MKVTWAWLHETMTIGGKSETTLEPTKFPGIQMQLTTQGGLFVKYKEQVHFTSNIRQCKIEPETCPIFDKPGKKIPPMKENDLDA